jgi:hypothetical protein
MMETGDGYLKTEEGHGQENVNKAACYYVEGELGCLGLGCDMDNWCLGLAEDDQVTSETEI